MEKRLYEGEGLSRLEPKTLARSLMNINPGENGVGGRSPPCDLRGVRTDNALELGGRSPPYGLRGARTDAALEIGGRSPPSWFLRSPRLDPAFGVGGREPPDTCEQ